MVISRWLMGSGTAPRRIVAAVAIGCVAVLPARLDAQDEDRETRRGVISTALWGGLAGLSLAVAHVNSPMEGAWVSDESAFPLGIIAGMSMALVARSHSVAGDGSQVPRVWFGVSLDHGLNREYALGYRAAPGQRLRYDVAIAVASDSWERVEQQTRCDPLFGCMTGDYIVDQHYQQTMGIAMRALHPLIESESRRVSLAMGGGPLLVRSSTYEQPEVRKTALQFNGAVMIEPLRRGGLTAEAGARATLPTIAEATIDNAALYVRVGIAWGHVRSPRAKPPRAH